MLPELPALVDVPAVPELPDVLAELEVELELGLLELLLDVLELLDEALVLLVEDVLEVCGRVGLLALGQPAKSRQAQLTAVAVAVRRRYFGVAISRVIFPDLLCCINCAGAAMVLSFAMDLPLLSPYLPALSTPGCGAPVESLSASSG